MEKRLRKQQRQRRGRAKATGTDARPRIAVFRSNKYIYAQVIDDVKGKTLFGVTEKQMDAQQKEAAKQKVARAKELGLLLAKKSLEKKIKKVIFDRAGYAYSGRVRALAEGAREGGLEF